MGGGRRAGVVERRTRPTPRSFPRQVTRGNTGTAPQVDRRWETTARPMVEGLRGAGRGGGLSPAEERRSSGEREKRRERG